jgi:hypothetical protein
LILKRSAYALTKTLSSLEPSFPKFCMLVLGKYNFSCLE